MAADNEVDSDSDGEFKLSVHAKLINVSANFWHCNLLS